MEAVASINLLPTVDKFWRFNICYYCTYGVCPHYPFIIIESTDSMKRVETGPGCLQGESQAHIPATIPVTPIGYNTT